MKLLMAALISAYFSAVQLDISNTEVYNNQALSQGEQSMVYLIRRLI